MNMKFLAHRDRAWRAALALVLVGGLAPLSAALAQPSIVSTIPANAATGVSPSAPVVFTFSTAMDTSLTTAQFFDTSGSSPAATASWSTDGTRMTNTPTPPFPNNDMVFWIVSGQDVAGNSLFQPSSGMFTTGSSGGGGGSGTNKITTFGVGTLWFFDQAGSGAPTPDPEISYSFEALTTLASNRTATSISLTLPTGAVTNLQSIPTKPEDFNLLEFGTNLASFQAAYPSGDYLFNVQAAVSNQTRTVTLPASLTQPSVPHAANFTAAQAVDATQPFTLDWDAFVASAATASIGLEISNPHTGQMLFSNGFPATATSALIPAGTLQAGSNYSATLTFDNVLGSTNATDATVAFRATLTRFTVTTTGGGATGTLVLTNAAWSAGTFSFDVASPPGQTFTVEYLHHFAGWQLDHAAGDQQPRWPGEDHRSASCRKPLSLLPGRDSVKAATSSGGPLTPALSPFGRGEAEASAVS